MDSDPKEPDSGPLIEFWTVYERPRDFPRGFVVRRSTVCRGELEPRMAPTALYVHGTGDVALAAARAAIPPGAYNLGRQEADDSAIREVWMLEIDPPNKTEGQQERIRVKWNG
jgi:hypothetical protein